MKTYIHLLLILALIIITAGCEDDKNTQYTGGGEGSDFHMTLVLKVPAVTDITRALSVADETTINSLDVLVFTNKDEAGGTFLYHAHGTDFTSSGSSTSTACVMLKETSGSEQHSLVLIANLREEIAALLTDGDITEGMTKEEVLELITFDTGSPWDVVTPRYLPMWGESGFRTLSAAASRINDIRMLRAVATVDVILAPGAKDNPAAFPNFALKTIKVCNASKSGLIAPESANYNSNASEVTLPSIPEGTTKGTLSYDFSTQFATNFRISREIYIAESSNNEPSEGHTEMTCILISGYYGAANTTEETWYRLDFIKDKQDGDRYDILRNHRYIFYITAVDGPGYATEEEALQSAPFNIESQIIVWDDNEAGDTYIDGIYYLSIRPETVYTFHSDEDQATVRIKTDVPDGFQITKITEEDESPATGWLTVDKTLDTFYGSGEAQVEVAIEVEENTSGTPRTGYIYLKAGRIEAKLTVTQGIEPKRSVVFNFIEYINVNGTDREVPAGGGTIDAIVNGNVGWKFKTNRNGIEDSMDEPTLVTAIDYTLSINLPFNASWEPLNTKVWVEYEGIAFQETTFTQAPGYYVTNASATEVTDASGGTSTVTITGSVPSLDIRAVSEGGEIATGTTSAGSTSGIGTLTIPSTDVDREITIQYSKDGGITWEYIIIFIQTQSNSIAARFAKSNIVWDNVNQKLTFATTREENAIIPASSQGVLFKWGSLIAISPAALSGTNGNYSPGKYPAGHIVYDPTDTYNYAWSNIPYISEATGMFGTHNTTEDDFATYNGNTGFNEATGKGDICRYISDKGWVTGRWRMPTADEFDQLIAEETSVSNGGPFANVALTTDVNNHYGYDQPLSGRWLGTGVTTGGSEAAPSVGLYFPAGGLRYNSTGSALDVGANGYYWSGSSTSTAFGYYLGVSSSEALRRNGNRQTAFPLRCVRE